MGDSCPKPTLCRKDLLPDVGKAALCPLSDVEHARKTSCRCPDACMALTSLELLSSFRAHQPSILKVQGCHSQQAKGRATNRTQTTGDKGGMTGLRRGRMSMRPRFIADVREGKAAHVGLRLQQPRLWVLEPPVAPEVVDNVKRALRTRRSSSSRRCGLRVRMRENSVQTGEA